METMMKKMILCLACFLLMVTLAPSLDAQQQPAVQADLEAQIFAPVSPAATVNPADPVPGAPSDLFLPAPQLKSCTLAICLTICGDCIKPKRPVCLNVNTCHCVCR
jgi:hypothetical protein